MITITPASFEAIQTAAHSIQQGRLVIFGTETVYGIGGDACNDHAVQAIFAAKNRPAYNPLISHVHSPEIAFSLGIATPLAEQLAHAFWPGPMTLVLQQGKHNKISKYATAGLKTIAIRIPSKIEAIKFLQTCNTPVAAPSANRAGRISPTQAVHAQEELGDAPQIASILDMGKTEAGIESTVIDARGETPVILRPGTITDTMVAEATSYELQLPNFSGNDSSIAASEIISPGQMLSHYAPEKPVALNVIEPQPNAIYIGFGNSKSPHFNLSRTGDLNEAAANLYHCLRQADKTQGEYIAIAPIPLNQVGIAINDRLERAAASDKKRV